MLWLQAFVEKVKVPCHWSDGVRGRDQGSLRRSPLGAIMNQIRRKRSVTDRKPLGRFLSWGSERIPEDGESGAAPPAGGQPLRPHRCQLNCHLTLVSCNFVQRMTSHSSLCALQPSPWQRRASVSSAGVEFVSSCTAWGRRPTAGASAWPTATSPPQTCWS